MRNESYEDGQEKHEPPAVIVGEKGEDRGKSHKHHQDARNSAAHTDRKNAAACLSRWLECEVRDGK